MARASDASGVLRRVRAGVLLAGLVLAALAGVSRPLEAQRAPKPGTRVSSANDGKRPAGWRVRADSAAGMKDTVSLINLAPGWQLKSGPPALVWRPTTIARGTYVLTSAIYLGPARTRAPQGFGVFIGGRDLDGPKATYTEFLVRNDGMFAVRRHEAGKTTMLKDWSPMFGLTLNRGTLGELALNTFRVVVDANQVQLVVNRAMAIALPRAAVAPDGVFGVRIGEGQELQVQSLGVGKS